MPEVRLNGVSRCDRQLAWPRRDARRSFATLIGHEPPLFLLLAGTEFEPPLPEVQARIDAVAELLRDGEHEQAAHLFVDTIVFGPGAWDAQLTPELRETFVYNAPTFLDELTTPTLSGSTWTRWRPSTDPPY